MTLPYTLPYLFDFIPVVPLSPPDERVCQVPYSRRVDLVPVNVRVVAVAVGAGRICQVPYITRVDKVPVNNRVFVVPDNE